MKHALKSVNEKCRVLLVRDGKNDADWLRARAQNGVGASESPIICGMSSYGSVVRLYGQKIGLIDPDDETEAMRWGKILERTIIDEYARETGRDVRPTGVLLQSIDYPHMIATPDAQQYAEDHDEPGITQVKLTSNAHEWRDGIPPRVICQMQHEMLVTGHSWGTAVALLGGTKLVWADVEFDATFAPMLVSKCGDFWDRVVNRVPMPNDWIDGSDETTEAIRAMFPERLTGTMVELPAEYFDVHHDLQTAESALGEAKEAVERMRNRLRMAIGDATFGRLPDGTTYSNKMQHRDGYTVGPAEYRVLRLMKGSAK